MIGAWLLKRAACANTLVDPPSRRLADFDLLDTLTGVFVTSDIDGASMRRAIREGARGIACKSIFRAARHIGHRSGAAVERRRVRIARDRARFFVAAYCQIARRSLTLRVRDG